MSPYFKLFFIALVAAVGLYSCVVHADEPDPKCWVCQFKPPIPGDPALPPAPSGHVPPKTLPPADQAPDPDVIPKDTKPGPLFDMDECDPDAQLIYNCNRLET